MEACLLELRSVLSPFLTLTNLFWNSSVINWSAAVSGLALMRECVIKELLFNWLSQHRTLTNGMILAWCVQIRSDGSRTEQLLTLICLASVAIPIIIDSVKLIELTAIQLIRWVSFRKISSTSLVTTRRKSVSLFTGSVLILIISLWWSVS